MRHLLSIGDLTRDDVERILETAGALQGVDEKLPTLRGKLVLSLFFESSTRTSSSFELAAKRLSADVMSLKAAGSSVDKGESLKDTVLTLAQYDPHAIVVRHPQIGAPQLVARYSGAAVVNAGDGKHQHPTQALLDLFTIRAALGELEGLHVAIVGDVLHSRVARSLIQALGLVGAHTTLVGPPTLHPARDRGDGLRDLDRDRRDRGRRRRLRPPDAARADGVGVRPEPARVRGALGRDAGARPARAEGDAPRADQPRRRDRRPRRRLARLADPRAGARGSRGADGGPPRPPGHGQPRARAGGGRMSTLFCRNGRSDSLVLEGRLAGGDCVAVTVTDGVISSIAPAAATPHVLAPAFVDPHVHLRSPGREDEETIASGTAAAAAGGYCAILAMPNTDPVVDSAAVLGSLVETARREALVPTGFMAAISKRLGGEELTEMGELADAGAAAFTDDGRPVTSAGLMRRALQYGSVTGRTLALHCEEPTLSRDGQVHEGAVCAELGFAPYPALAESAMVERDLSLAGYESRPLHLMHLSAKESVEALRHAHERGVKATAEVTPHHLVLTDEAVRSLDPNVKMNPPLRADDDRRALIDALRDGTIACVATDHAPHSREEKETPFEEAPFGVTGLETSFAALYTHLVQTGLVPLETLLERMSAGPARALGLPEPKVEVGARANLVLLDLEQEWTVTESGFRSRSANSWLLGRKLRGAVLKTVADGRVVHG